MLTEMHKSRLRKTLRIVKEAAERSAWNQLHWGVAEFQGPQLPTTLPECGTAFCFAGHAAINAPGIRPLWWAEFEDADGGEKLAIGCWPFEFLALKVAEARAAGAVTVFMDEVKTADDDTLPVEEWAQDYFGLTYEQADTLFAASNTMERLEQLVERYCAA